MTAKSLRALVPSLRSAASEPQRWASQASLMRVGWPSWSVEISDAWSVTDHAECLTLELSSEGALQLSSARKFEGNVTPEDLLSSEELRGEWGPWKPAVCGTFTGIVYEYSLSGQVWQRWFLRSGPILLLVTYIATPEAALREQGAVAHVLSSARFEADSEA